MPEKPKQPIAQDSGYLVNQVTRPTPPVAPVPKGFITNPDTRPKPPQPTQKPKP